MNDPPRILIVDDEPNIRLMYRTTLAQAGFGLVEAEDGEAALDHLGKGTFDLIVLDLLMPIIGGMEVLRRMRQAGDETPVIVVTAHGSVPDAVEAMRLGAIDILAKPIRPAALLAKATEVVERHAADGPAPVHHPEPKGVVVTLAPSVLDLTAAKRALNRRQFAEAENLLNQALDLDENNPEVLNLIGVLQESLGRDHAAYRAYRAALTADRHYAPALDNLRRYCARFDLDFHSPSINPAVGRGG